MDGGGLGLLRRETAETQNQKGERGRQQHEKENLFKDFMVGVRKVEGKLEEACPCTTL
jgi:hypothetical protein